MGIYRSSKAQLANLKPPEPIYDEPKTQNISARVTPTAKKKLKAIADNYGLSVSELFERIARDEFELIRKAS